MKNHILRRAVGGLFAATLLTSAFSVSAADLVAIYRDAIAQDPVFSSARFAYDAAKEASPIARAATLPSIGLGSSATRVNSETDFAGSSTSRDYTNKAYTLSLTQPLFRMQTWIAVDQAALQVKQAEALFADAKQSLITRTAQAYFDVLLAQDNVELSAAQKKAFAEQLAAAKRNFEVGTSTIVDTYEAQAKYDLAVSKEIFDQADFEIKKHALQQLIGKKAPSLSALKDNVALPLPTPADPEKWVAAAEEASPSIAQARALYEIATKDVDRNKAGHYPTLDLVGSYGYNSAPSTSSTLSGSLVSKTTQLGLSLNIPLYAGGGTQSRIRQALSAKDQSEQNLENSKRSVAQNVRSSFLNVTSGVAQVKALEASLISSKASLDSTLLGKDVGVRTNVDVLNSQQQLFQTRRDLQQARYSTILAQLRLKSAAGRLTEDDLAEVNRLLQR
jgi:outer membrane protein